MRFLLRTIYLACLAAAALALGAAPCNTPPTVAPESVSVDLGSFQIVDVLANASDPDGQALTVTLSSRTCPPQVSARLDPSQTLTIAASALVPSCRIGFHVSDGAGGTTASHVTVSVVDPAFIFSDGFEQGTTDAWSRT